MLLAARRCSCNTAWLLHKRGQPAPQRRVTQPCWQLWLQECLRTRCCLPLVERMLATLRACSAAACAGMAMSKDVVAGANYMKAGSDPALRPDSEYPDWLWDIMKPREPLFALQRKLGPERDIKTISLEEVRRAAHGQRPVATDSPGSWRLVQRPHEVPDVLHRQSGVAPPSSCTCVQRRCVLAPGCVQGGGRPASCGGERGLTLVCCARRQCDS